MSELSHQTSMFRQTFSHLHERLKECQQNTLETEQTENMFTTLQFQVDHMCWYFAYKNGVVEMEEISYDNVGDKPINAACSISTDSATMWKICNGDISFPAAYLSRKLKLNGDQKVLKSISVPMKDALDAVRKMKLEFPPEQRNISQSSENTNTLDQILIQAKIIEAFAPNFKYNINDNTGQKATRSAPSKDVAVRYKIEVSIVGTEEQWHVSHRYSHFLQLRNELVEQGYTAVPVISSKSSLFNSLERVVHSRIIHLGMFLNECLAQLSSDNETLNQFLARPVDVAHAATNAHHTAAVAEVGSNAGSTLDQAPATPPPPSYQHVEPNEREKCCEEALEHAWSAPITWSSGDLHHSRFLVRELATQKSTLEGLSKSNNEHASNFINRLLDSLQRWALVAVCGVISAYFYERSFIEEGLHVHATAHLEVAIKLTFALLLLFPRTRYWCVAYCILWLVAINSAVVGVRQVSVLVNSYSEHWTMYRNHIQWLRIRHSVVVVPEEFRSPPSVAHLLRRTLPGAVWELTMGSLSTVFNSTRSAFLSTTSLYGAINRAVEALASSSTEDLLAAVVKFVMETDLAMCGIVMVYAVAASVLSSAGLCRALWIYGLGLTLLASYATLKVVCVVLFFSPAVCDALFARLDNVMAPFIVAQIGQLRSVFVKFAQYFGGRSDVVTPLWTELLSQLQDACPPSSEDYVRRTVEEELGAALQKLDGWQNNRENSPTDSTAAKFVLEDLFESFSAAPIASASIGQVHTATLKHSSLMRILGLQQQMRTSSGINEENSASNQPSPSRQQEADETTEEEGEEERAQVKAEETSPSTHHGGDTAAREDAIADADLSWYESLTDPAFTSAVPSEAAQQLVSVVVKVQHEGIEPLMLADMRIVLVLIKWASLIDSRWETMQQVMRSWDLTMRGELDYRQEAENLREMRGIMEQSRLGAATPYPVPGLAAPRVLVMTRLFGHKVTDKAALLLHNVDREALLTRIAHCSAYQLLVAGVFNADPHAGNILFSLSTQQPAYRPASQQQQNSPYRRRGLDDEQSIESNSRWTYSAHRPSRTPLSTVQESRRRANSDLDSDSGSVASSLTGVHPLEQQVSAAGLARHIYDATPGKSVSFSHRMTAENMESRGSIGPSSRRIIYDATPAKGVGFAADVSMHSAEEHSPSSCSLTPPRRSPAAGAGHTPFPTGSRRFFPTTPGSGSRYSTGKYPDQAANTPGVAVFMGDEDEIPQLIPGLLDFGMTVRLNPERRRSYCRLILALCDGDLKTAAAELRSVGYTSNQSDRAPERDAEFFEHLFRDAAPRGASKQEREGFSTLRSQQKAADIAAGVREKGGRSIATVPDDFLFLTRLIGLLRGLTSELDCSCPILYILALNAKIGLLHKD